MITPGRDALSAHVAECDVCQQLAPPMARIAAALGAAPLQIDAAALSQQAVRRVAPLLAAMARAVFWPRLARVLGIALVPLPALIAVDALLLFWLYGQMSAWLPSGVATYLIASYAAMVSLCVGLAYAAIPLLLGRSAPPAASLEVEG
jgi:hypothetical protein